MRFKNNKNAVPAKEFRATAGSEVIVASDGTINASSKADLINQQQRLAQEVSSGRILSYDAETAAAQAEEQRESFAELCAAMTAGVHSEKMREVGSWLSATLNESIERNGFMRRILLRGDVQPGAPVRHRMKRINTVAHIVNGNGSTTPTFVREQYLTPPEFAIVGHLMIPQKDLHQGSPELLNEKYQEALRMIMVREDVFMINAAKAFVSDNPIIYVSGSYSPSAFGQIQGQIKDWGHAPTVALLANDVMTDMISSPTFASYFDPVSKYDIVMTGQLGTLHGTELLTDQFRDPMLKVLNRGDCIMFGDPSYVGAYTERGPVEATPQDGRVHGSAARGWWFEEFLSMAIHSGRSISRGSR